MTLICTETKRGIDADIPLYALTRTDIDTFSAVSGTVVDRIPDECRLPEPIAPVSGGFDIHEAQSGTTSADQYDLRGFSLGRFLFSVSRVTAEEFFPSYCTHHPVAH